MTFKQNIQKIKKYAIFLSKSLYHYVDLVTDISLIVLFFQYYKTAPDKQ